MADNTTEIKKKEIQAKIEKLAALFDSSTSVSNMLSEKYTQVLEEVKKLSADSKEKIRQIEALEKERDVLKNSLQQNNVEKEKKDTADSTLIAGLTAQIDSLKAELQTVNEKQQNLKKADSLQERDSAEKEEIINSIFGILNETSTLLKHSGITRGRFNELLKDAKYNYKSQLSKDSSKFNSSNQHILDKLSAIISEITAPDFIDKTIEGEKYYKPETDSFLTTNDRNEIVAKEENAARAVDDLFDESDSSGQQEETAPGPTEEREAGQDTIPEIIPDTIPDTSHAEDIRTEPEKLSASERQCHDSGIPGNKNIFSDSVKEKTHPGLKENVYSDSETENVRFQNSRGSGEQVYTLIEKIENSRIEIHTQSYGPGTPPGIAGTPVFYPFGNQPIQGMPVEVPPRKDSEKTEDNSKLSEKDPPADKNSSETESNKNEDAEITAELTENEQFQKQQVFNPYTYKDDVFEEVQKPSTQDAAPQKKKAPSEEIRPQPVPGPDPAAPQLGVDKNKLDITLHEDDYEKYGKYLKLTYLFDNMPSNVSYSKYKRSLRNACRITLLGNLEEGLNLFNTLKQQKLPSEYKEMIDKNIRDVKYYLRGKFRSSEADLE